MPIQGTEDTGTNFQKLAKVLSPQYNLTVTGSGWTTSNAVGQVYQTENGTYRMRFNIKGTSGSVTSLNLTIANISAMFDQAVTVWNNSSSGPKAYISGGVIYINGTPGSTIFLVSGDISLASLPSFVKGM